MAVWAMTVGSLWAAKDRSERPAPERMRSTMATSATSTTAALPRPISHGDRESSMVALTFDDAPHPEYVPRLLALFRAENVKATFFLVGKQVHLFPEVARAIVADGHEIGNHSLGHRDLSQASVSTIEEEIVGMQMMLKERLGVAPVLYRPAFGAALIGVRRVCQRERLSIILWDVDTNDWRNGATSQTIVRSVLDNVTSGSIVLFHATHARSIEAVAELISVLRARGYELVTVSRLLHDRSQREAARRLMSKKENSSNTRLKQPTGERSPLPEVQFTTPTIQTPLLPIP